MRLVCLAGAAAAALTLAVTPATAGYFPDVTILYGFGPIGDAFEPSDRRAPVRIVDEGPVISGPGVYAYHTLKAPTYWQGGYSVVTPDVYPTPFPYVRHMPDVRVFAPRRGIAPYAVSVYWPAPRARFIRVRPQR
jgi:hypothetical protein